MERSFDEAFEMLINFEGYKSQHPNDPGKFTIFGVSSRYWPADVERMATMSKEEALAYAKQFYRTNFWNPMKCDSLKYPLDIIVFDTAVNCKKGTAERLLSETTNWREYLLRRLYYYARIADEKPELRVFFRGWVNRVLALWLCFRGEY